MDTIHLAEFPFEEIRTPSGDYFASQHQVRMAGYPDNQIWSVVVEEGIWVFGPSHHWVNVVGYIATAETHDGETYYSEPNDDDDDDDDEEEEETNDDDDEQHGQSLDHFG